MGFSTSLGSLDQMGSPADLSSSASFLWIAGISRRSPERDSEVTREKSACGELCGPASATLTIANWNRVVFRIREFEGLRTFG